MCGRCNDTAALKLCGSAGQDVTKQNVEIQLLHNLCCDDSACLLLAHNLNGIHCEGLLACTNNVKTQQEDTRPGTLDVGSAVGVSACRRYIA